MSSRINGYDPERILRPSSEQMADLHVYLVPPDIWREKFNNALNQHINDTVSLGFIRVHPETKVYALRDEIEQQLGADLVPREFVFLKSVGRSLTQLKSRQEATMKVKHFLPPRAYAPELYLLEATPEVRQAIAASSEGSTRPDTRTSYDFEYARQNPQQHHMISSPRRGQMTDKPYEEQYLPPLSATPPHTSAGEKGKPNNQSNRNNVEEDSGIAGFSPDTYRGNDNHVLDRRKEADDSKHLKIPPPQQTDRSDNFPPQQSTDNNRDQSNWDTSHDRNYVEQGRKSPALVHHGLRDTADDEKEHENERHQIEEEVKQMKSTADEDLARYPSPPPLRLASPDRDSESAKERKRREKKEGLQKITLKSLSGEELLKQLEKAREARRNAERMREELVKQAKLMQNKTQNRRNHARDVWKKRYFEEKKKTGPLEDQMNKLRHELDIIHKRLLSTLEGPKEKATKLGDIKHGNKAPAQQKPLNNFKVQATRLQHEIEDVRRRVEHAKMRLTSEMKLRNQAETELRALRAELTQKKINLTLSRNSNLTTYAPPAADVNLISSRTTAITPRS